MNKRGQFYLVAVIIIIALAASVATIYNQVITKKSDRFNYELSKEIEFEASKVLDRGMQLSLSEDEISNQIKTITNHYAKTNPQTDFIIVYGGEENIHFFYYNQTDSGNVGIDFNGPITTVLVSGPPAFQSETRNRNESNTITINIASDVSYTYEMRRGQFLFVVLKTEKDGERYIEVPE